MKKLAISLLVFAILFSAFLLFALIISESSKADNQRLSFNSTSACFNEKCVNIKIADTKEERENGLMFVSQMHEDDGMLFVFEKQDIYPFWMKNTLIPLDIIWFDENQSIVFIKMNAELCREDLCEIINPNKPAKYVLEINAGLVDKLNLENK